MAEMSVPKSTHAIVFPEGNGPGYLLVKPLKHGAQAQVYLVMSLKDGKYYVRKKLKHYDSFSEPFSTIVFQPPRHQQPRNASATHMGTWRILTTAMVVISIR